jgi:hypothetical protein
MLLLLHFCDFTVEVLDGNAVSVRKLNALSTKRKHMDYRPREEITLMSTSVGTGIHSKAFVVRAAKASTSNPLYKCFTAWKEVRVPFSIKAEGTI